MDWIFNKMNFKLIGLEQDFLSSPRW